MSKRPNIHPIPLSEPVDTTSTTVTSPEVNAGEAEVVIFIVSCGAITGDTAVITIEECSDIAGAGNTAIAYRGHETAAAGTDTIVAEAAVASTGYTLAATDDNKLFVAYVDPDALTDGKPFVRCVVDPGGSMSAFVVGILAIVVPKYGQAVPASFLT